MLIQDRESRLHPQDGRLRGEATAGCVPSIIYSMCKTVFKLYIVFTFYIYFIYPQSWEMLVTAAKTMKTTYNNMI